VYFYALATEWDCALDWKMAKRNKKKKKKKKNREQVINNISDRSNLCYQITLI